MSDYYREVLQRVFADRALTNLPPCTDQDVASIEREVQLLEKRGATVAEAVKYVKCLEEYNPGLEEAVALRRMSNICKQIEARTGKSWQDIF